MRLITVLPYLLIAAGLLSSLGLFLALKREIRQHVFRHKTTVEEMMARLLEAERPVQFVPARPLGAGLNLNNRVHAMRMLRRGEDIAHIAAALAVPRREVELLVRVQSIGKTRVASASSDS
jgi:hypothetical protein